MVNLFVPNFCIEYKIFSIYFCHAWIFKTKPFPRILWRNENLSIFKINSGVKFANFLIFQGNVMRRKFFIGVAGSSGSGKTTFVENLKQYYESQGLRCAIISMDFYYKDLSALTLEERNKVNFDHPDSLRVDVYANHFRALRSGESVEVPTYNFATHTPNRETTRILADAYDVFIGDGILSLIPDLNSLYDARIFVNTDLELCFNRRTERDIKERGRTKEQTHAQWHATVLPMFREFVEPCIERAHVVVSNSTNFAGAKDVHFDMSAVTAFLNEHFHFGNKTAISQMHCTLMPRRALLPSQEQAKTHLMRSHL